MVHVKDKLILFGGFFDNLREVKYYNDVHVFDLLLYKWTKIVPLPNAPQPPPRSGPALAILAPSQSAAEAPQLTPQLACRRSARIGSGGG